MGRQLTIDAASTGPGAGVGKPVENCWFCLSNPSADVDLVVSVGAPGFPGSNGGVAGFLLGGLAARSGPRPRACAPGAAMQACLRCLLELREPRVWGGLVLPPPATAGIPGGLQPHQPAGAPNPETRLPGAGEEVYAAIDKGAITDSHVLLVSVEHFPSTLSLSPTCHAELEK